MGFELERKARNIVSPGKPYGADNTIFSADCIEVGSFAEVMICLLRLEKGYGVNGKIEEFSNKLGNIWGKSVHMIEPTLAQSLLNEFEELMK